MRRAFASGRIGGSRVLGWVIPVALLLLSNSTRAQDLYGCDNAGRTFVINTVSGAGTFLCTLPTHPDPGATEMEYDEIADVGFVQARDGAFQGQSFDVSNCAAIGGPVPTGNLAFNGLEFVAGVLYGAAIPNTCDPSVLAILDPVTGTPTIIGPTGVGPISGLAWDPGTQILYGVTGCSQLGPSRLVRINIATGAATVVGSTGQSLGSLEFGVNGILYAGGDNRDGGNLYIVNPVTGTSSLVGPTGFSNVTGLALVIRPVPVLISRFAATPGEGGVRLAWDLAFDEPVLGFRIYRAVPGSNPRSITGAGLISSPARSYTDHGVEAGKTYEYTLAVQLTDRELSSPVVTVRTRPLDLVLFQNSPNPFNPLTTISFSLACQDRASLSIFDASGNLVRTLLDGVVDEGRHEYLWDGKNANGTTVGSGVYFYRLTSGARTLTKKMVLLK